MLVTEISKITLSGLRTNRIIEADSLRALSFFTVVLQHAIGAYGSRPAIPLGESVILGLIFVFSKFAVPMFVFLSGLSLFYTYRDRFDLKKFFSKRLVTILLPYAAWTVFYSYYSRYGYLSLGHSGDVAKSIFNYSFAAFTLHNLAFGVSYYHMWFVVMIFQFYLLFPLLLRISRWFRAKGTDTLNRRLLFALNIGWLILLAVRIYFLPYVSVRMQSGLIYRYLTFWSDRHFIYYLGYFLLGAQAGLDIDNWRTRIKNISAWVWLGVTVSFFIVCWEMFTYMSNNHLNFMVAFTLKPEVALLCLGEILYLYRLSLLISNSAWQVRFLRFASKYSFGAYFLHALMLQIICLQFIDKLPVHDYILATALALALASLWSLIINWVWAQAYNLVKPYTAWMDIKQTG